MEDKVNPLRHWPNPSWKFSIDSFADNVYPPDPHGDANSVAFPAYLNNHAYIYAGIPAPAPFFAATVADRPLPMPLTSVTMLTPGLESSAVYAPHKRSLIVYQEHQAPMTAPLMNKGTQEPRPELQGSNETNVTDVGGEEAEGVHENTDGINVLLDSDSDEGCEKVNELERAKKYCTAENDTLSVESVASAGGSEGSTRPAKKRRLSSGSDKSVVDTASSARPDLSVEQKLLVNSCDAQSCCIGEVESDHKFALREGDEAEGDGPVDQERRRERIQETVTALRKIVPGGIAKDATAVLDEAICYLQYLKLKVKTLGAVSL